VKALALLVALGALSACCSYAPDPVVVAGLRDECDRAWDAAKIPGPRSPEELARIEGARAKTQACITSATGLSDSRKPR
jgi:hypothetical protein